MLSGDGTQCHSRSAALALVARVVASGGATGAADRTPSAPEPNPPYTRGSQPLCPLKLTGIQSNDYGTRLYLVDKSARPLWAAGRYRPQLGELDCIGIVLEQWTSGAIQFHFGSGYLQGHYPQLHNGDFVQVVWNHLTVGVHVKYGPDGVAPGS